ncbi:MAG: sugar ABC transporter ATP-binding protein, partial [Acetobacteraceae bacterium]
NGAGKSTLVKLLAGYHAPDAGHVSMHGRTLRLTSPKAAFRAGIATVHQELSLFSALTVAQNILIGREERTTIGFIRERRIARQVERLLETLGINGIDANAQVGALSLAARQLVEIAKAMSFDPAVLILDEPTSALSPVEVHRLLEVVRGLRARGRAIVFISHRMEEIEDIANRITILRSGRVVGSFPGDRFDRAEALALMLGKSRDDGVRQRPAVPGSDVPVVLSVKDLTLPGRVDHVSFDLYAGEVLGLAGLEGQGQKDVLFALFGVWRHGLGGHISIGSRAIMPRRPRAAIAAGIGFIPDDRKSMGGFLRLSVAHNISIAMLDRLRRGPLLDLGREARLVGGLIERLRIVCASPRLALASLSGGNQQKVIAAKWLARELGVYLFCDPTRGVDAGARESLYATVLELARDGKGVLVYSTDIAEFPILCARVLVLRGGHISGSLSGAEITEKAILALSFSEAA